MGRTNIVLDDALVRKAMKVTGLKTKRAVIHRPLEELVARDKRKEILKLEGKIRWAGDLDAWRKRRV